MVMVNLPTAGVDYHVPFGGRKGSSYGPREQGRYAAEFYTTVKTSYVSPEAPAFKLDLDLQGRQVRRAEAARQGRDRHGLPRQGHLHRQGSRAQDHRARGVPRPGVRHGVPLAVPERGFARRQAAPSAHRQHPRRGGGRGLRPHRDGAGHRRRPFAARHARQAAAGRRRAADRLQVLRRARVRVRRKASSTATSSRRTS